MLMKILKNNNKFSLNFNTSKYNFVQLIQSNVNNYN